MTINKTAYETTACVGYRIDKTTAALKVAFHTGGLEYDPTYNIYKLFDRNAACNDVPAFAHPIAININEADMLFIDVRSFGKWDDGANEFKVRNEIDNTLLVARAKLNSIWINETPTWLRDVSPAPMALFASWISEAVGKRFALDPKEQFNLGILAAIFYNSQFTDSVELDERDKLRAINAVTKALRASAQDVMEIMDKVSIVNNVFEFCSRAEEISGSIRLKELNPGVLFGILGGTWFGANAREMVAVAIEHPPTWMAILLSAYTERTFKNSQISKLTERNSFKKSGEDFVAATVNLLRVAAK